LTLLRACLADMHALFVVVGSEVLVAGGLAGQQRVDAGERGIAGGGEDFLLGHALMVASPRAAPR